MHRNTGMSSRARWIIGVAGGTALAASGLGMAGKQAEPAAGFTLQVRERDGESDAAYERALHREAMVLHAERVLRAVAEDPAARQAAGGWAAGFSDASGGFDVPRAVADLAERVRTAPDPATGTIRVEVRGPASADAAWLAGAVQRACLEADAAGERRGGEVQAAFCRARIEDFDRQIEQVQTQRESLIVQRLYGPEIAAAVGEELRRVGAKIDELGDAAHGAGPAEAEQIARRIDVLRQRREELTRRDVDLTRTALSIEALRVRQEALARSRDALAADLARATARRDAAGRLSLIEDAGPAR